MILLGYLNLRGCLTMSFVVAHMQKLGDKVHMKPEAWHRVGLKSPNEPDKQPKKRPEKNQG